MWPNLVSVLRWFFQGLAAWFLWNQGKKNAEEKVNDVIREDLKEELKRSKEIDQMDDKEVLETLRKKKTRKKKSHA